MSRNLIYTIKGFEELSLLQVTHVHKSIPVFVGANAFKLFFSLQKFKLHLASTVISEENSSLVDMGTNQLLDLFTISGADKGQTARSSGPQHDVQGLSGVGNNIKEVLGGLTELWDEKQYEEEYDLSNFVKSLHG